MDALRRAFRTTGWTGVVLLTLAGAAHAACLDPGRHAELLVRHTAEVADLAGVRVDYRGLRRDPDWAALVASLERCDPTALATRAERLAFWINAYNLLAMDLVQRHYPVESIRDIGSWLRPVWGREAGRVGGRPYTLDEIEHDILRPLGEPRIHAALVCASSSCPSLAREPYQPSRIADQLDAALRRWLADPRKGARLDAETDTLHLSRVFDWFAEDFEAHGGVLAYLAPHLPDEIRDALALRGDALRLRYLEYDWSLNDLARADPPANAPSPGERS